MGACAVRRRTTLHTGYTLCAQFAAGSFEKELFDLEGALLNRLSSREAQPVGKHKGGWK